MQYHLDGFRPGDPRVTPAGGGAARPGAQVDVLIVGCGPAGLALAAQLAAFADISVRIVEEKAGPLSLGQADGIACRTMEMFEAFGFSERVLREAYWVNETTFWKPDDARREAIVRHGRIEDTEEGLSEFPHVILNQARVHDFFLETMRQAPGGIVPDYGLRVASLEIGAAADYPVRVELARMDAAAAVEVVRARYVVGCDGARSVVRRALGLALVGDSANQAWGVMDVLAVTDFPDIRLKATIHSAQEGSVLIIPREGGYLVRLYVELDKLRPDERVAGRAITAAQLIAAAQRILRPYTLEVKEIAWWSVYEIGQRLCDTFDDVPANDASGRVPRVFIAGDACHTHSPKAGQGMNVSMQDSFNLGWKLASVLHGSARPALLNSYSRERQAIAAELIAFDREFAKMFSARPADPGDPGSQGIDPAEFQRYFVRQGRFTAGTATRYAPSAICAAGIYRHLAAGFPIGMRFHSAPVLRLADAKPVQLGHVLKADGRWRLMLFAPREQGVAAIAALCAYLGEDARSPLVRYTPTGLDADTVIDVRAVFRQDRRELDIGAMPAALLPRKGRFGLRDYEKMFCPDFGRDDIFELRQIDPAGCIVVVRPDQYVAHILPLDRGDALAAFFDGFMMPAGRG